MPRQPTLKQVKTLQGIAAGKSMKRAMIDAGYSLTTAHKGMSIFRDNSFKEAVMGVKVKAELARIGTTPTKIAQKLTDLMDAERTIVVDKDTVKVEDNRIQLDATKLVNDIWNDNDSLHPTPKRRITFEEFSGITDDKS